MGLLHFFDKLEDRVRGRLSRNPIPYGIIGGIAVVLFWRGVWHSADIIEMSGGTLSLFFTAPVSLIISACVLLMTGLFVSFFIGDRIILSGLTHEKKLEEKTESEVREEGAHLREVHQALNRLEKEVALLREAGHRK